MNQYIDFTILKPFATESDVIEAYKICRDRSYKGFCFPSCYLPLLRSMQKSTSSDNPLLITVIGFPLGYQSVEEKVQSILSFSEFPPDEIDFVINLSALRSQDWNYLNKELFAIKEASQKLIIHSFYKSSPILKAIIESPHWDEKTLEKICFLCIANGIDFIKTSTGFLEEGITMEKKFQSIKLIKQFTEYSCIKIKISGGIRDLLTAQRAINELGVDRIGTSSIL